MLSTIIVHEKQDFALHGTAKPNFAPHITAKPYTTQYSRDGYLHLKGFYNTEEVKQLRKFTDEIQNTKEEIGGQMMWFEKSRNDGKTRILQRVEDFCRRHKGMANFFLNAKTSRLQVFMEILLGEEVFLFKDKINFKLPGGDGIKAHQDQAAGWGKYIDSFVSVAVFVDRSTVQNGCLQVAPGLHKDGLLGKEWEPIEHLDLPYQYVECEPGDVIIFDSFVPHKSEPNKSGDPRRAIFLTYNPTSEGDRMEEYYCDKRRDFPPDIERPKGKEYIFRV